MSDIQESSAKLLNLYVEDLLCLAQIERGNFRKNISNFNIKKAIEEVNKIQKDKIDAK